MIQRPQQATGRQGTTIPEMALVSIVFFMFLFGILEYGRFVFTLNMLNNAAREGARYAVVQTTSVSTTQVRTYVDAYLTSSSSGLLNYSPSNNIKVFQANTTTGADNGGGWTNAGQGQAVGVTISGTYNPFLPNFLFLNNSLPIQATAIMYSEGGL